MQPSLNLKQLYQALCVSSLMAISGIAHANTDELVLQVSKLGTINPNQVAIVPFTGNANLSHAILTQLNQTELKSSSDKLPAQAKNSEEVLARLPTWRNTGYRYVVVGDSHAILGDKKVATNFQVIDLETAKTIGSRQTHVSGNNPKELQVAASAISAKIHALITGISNDLVGRIAYVQETGDARQKNSSLVLMNVATQEKSTIDSVQGAILSPTFSPDGTMLAYTVQNNDELPVIYLYRFDNQQKTLITPFKGNNLSPAFSSDGQALLFSGSHDHDNPNIYRLDLIANRLSAITDSQGAENSPSYLPNGQIIFTADQGTRSQSIYRMSAGAKPIRIATGSNPRVSRDGLKLAYVQGSNLLVSRIDGLAPKVVANVGTEGLASFSPNAQYIIYAGKGAQQGLVIEHLDSGRQIILPTSGVAKDPAWSAQ